jgi:LuxR family transcriptional regulator, maltose regulon positive regulatory protein
MTEGTQNPTETASELPPAQRHIIKRPRLTKLLDEAEARVILLVAPAGYGKTTLAREWLDHRRRRALVYRVRETIDPTVVATGLATALETIAPVARRSLQEFLTASTSPDENPELLADILTQEVASWPSDAWLFIDDYHAIAGTDICERVVARCIEDLNCNVLVTSRERPAWVTSRLLLYGDVLEFGQHALAMTSVEASTVLADTPGEHGPLLELAHGWPAVVGLGALLPQALHDVKNVPTALYDFIAQELYEGLSHAVRRDLALLAIPRALNTTIVTEVLGPSAAAVIRDAVRVGFLSVREDELEIHPLARAFLRGKLAHTAIELDVLARFVNCLIERHLWDDAFAVISEFALGEELSHLLSVSVQQILASGGLATLERWIAWGERNGVETAELSLAHAELYLRRGEWVLAEALAISAAQHPRAPEFAARCYICAGQSAQLSDSFARAADNFRLAFELSESTATRRRALWGRFIAALHEDVELGEIAYQEMKRAPDVTPTHLVRLNQAQMLIADLTGGVGRAARLALSSESLLEHVDDPLIRSGFLNTLSNSLVVAGFYEDAQRIANLELAEAKRFRLEFVMPSALLNLAGAKLGLGSYTSASTLVDQACSHGQSDDSYLAANAVGIRIRIALCRQEMFDTALEPIRFGDAVRPDIMGEVLACLAVTESIYAGETEARARIEAANELDTLLTTRALLAASECILSLRSGDPATIDRHLISFANVIKETDAIDSAVVALRASPDLLQACAAHDQALNALRLAAARSGDSTLAATAGITAPQTRSSEPLSPREIEILGLVAQGFRNADVAKRLFISPKTVKTHLQHIYAKLDVNSRTEAAVKAKEAGLLG